MHTERITLQGGRVVTLAPPDLYQLVAGDVQIPNQALLDISDLLVYGGILTAPKKDAERLIENRREITMQFEIARLCIQEPALVLTGDAPEGALTPRDLTPPDLARIITFFRTGSAARVPAPANPQPDGSTRADPAVPAVGEDT